MALSFRGWRHPAPDAGVMMNATHGGSIYTHRVGRDLCRIMLKDAGYLMAVGLVIYLVIGVEKTFRLHREMGGSET
ncbi:MAG: hypothetical protein ABFS39_17930 [Pseudomonadota bacterium]